MQFNSGNVYGIPPTNGRTQRVIIDLPTELSGGARSGGISVDHSLAMGLELAEQLHEALGAAIAAAKNMDGG